MHQQVSLELLEILEIGCSKSNPASAGHLKLKHED